MNQPTVHAREAKILSYFSRCRCQSTSFILHEFPRINLISQKFPRIISIQYCNLECTSFFDRSLKYQPTVHACEAKIFFFKMPLSKYQLYP